MDSASPKRLLSEAKSDETDRISCLPEQAIGSILSRLTTREAQATCVLSSRWRHLYTSLVTDLDFDWSHLLEEMADNLELAERERGRYVKWVDNVVRCQSKGEHALRRFTLRFDLNMSWKSSIDPLIRFALAKRVKVLVLCFIPACSKDLRPDCDPSRLPYVLGREILMDADVGRSGRASGLGNFGLSPSISWDVGCRYLEQLSLSRVNVEGELIEELLATCPALEKLDLECVDVMKRLRVSGQSLKLKYLRVAHCEDLQSVVVSDTNLVSFTYRGKGDPVRWSLDKVPQLTEVAIESFLPMDMRMILWPLSSFSSVQIVKFYFWMPFPDLLWNNRRGWPKLMSVKQLELRTEGFKDTSLLALPRLFEAFPCLRSFVLKLIYPMDLIYRQRELERVAGPPLRHLKVFEFYNYCGRSCDLELVNYFIENASALEKLVVNPCEEVYGMDGLEKVKEPRERALQQLMGKLPSRIELVIN